MKIKKLNPCPCGGTPEFKRVGNMKQYYVGFCSTCGKTPVPYDCARNTMWGAKREWNRRIK